MMTAVVVVDTEVITIRGPQVRECLRRARMRPIYVGTTHGWMLDRGRLPDALAALERASYVVRLEGELVAHAEPAHDRPHVQASEPGPVDEAPLW